MENSRMTSPAPARTFADYIKQEGLRIRDWEADEHALSVIADFYYRFSFQLAAGTRNGESMILDVHLIDRVGFNAFAGSFDEGDVIAINRDVPIILIKLARAMVSHGYILPEQKTDGLTVTPIVVPGTVKEFLSAVRVWDVQPLADPKRESVARHLARLASQYVMAHEFTHVYNGHVDYLKMHHGKQLLIEIEGSDLPPPASYERETLEWDADVNAAQAVLETATKPIVNNVTDRAAWTIPAQNEIGTRDDAIQLAMIAPAMCALFLAEADKGGPLDTVPRTHPHSLFRFMDIFTMVMHVISFRTGDASDEVASMIGPNAEAYFKSLKATLPLSTRLDILTVADKDVSAAHRTRIGIWNETWACMYPELDNLKRGGVLAPPRPGLHPAFPNCCVTG